MKNFVKYNWPSIIWAAFLLVVSLVSASRLPDFKVQNRDKIGHVFCYALLAGLLFYGWHKQGAFLWLHRSTFIKVVVVSALYGMLIEFLQSMVGRSFDWWDGLANACGALLGGLVYGMFRRENI